MRKNSDCYIICAASIICVEDHKKCNCVVIYGKLYREMRLNSTIQLPSEQNLDCLFVCIECLILIQSEANELDYITEDLCLLLEMHFNDVIRVLVKKN